MRDPFGNDDALGLVTFCVRVERHQVVALVLMEDVNFDHGNNATAAAPAVGAAGVQCDAPPMRTPA